MMLVDEVVIYGDNDEKGFMLVRVLGENMNPAKIAQLMQALQKSDYKGEGLEQLKSLLFNGIIKLLLKYAYFAAQK